MSLYLFSASTDRGALAHFYRRRRRRRLSCFSYKQIYIYYRETHHIFRVVVTHNDNQTEQEREREREKESDGTRNPSEASRGERDASVVDDNDNLSSCINLESKSVLFRRFLCLSLSISPQTANEQT